MKKKKESKLIKQKGQKAKEKSLPVLKFHTMFWSYLEAMCDQSFPTAQMHTKGEYPGMGYLTYKKPKAKTSLFLQLRNFEIHGMSQTGANF